MILTVAVCAHADGAMERADSDMAAALRIFDSGFILLSSLCF
ncbi:hypothetical protein [Aquabacter sp. CN5-332]